MAVASERAERFDLKRVLVGRPRATGELDETLLSKKLALPIFASDPLSSVAYATEVRARRPRRGLRRGALHPPDLDRDRRPPRDRRPLLPADRPGLLDERRRLRRREREPRHAAGPRR